MTYFCRTRAAGALVLAVLLARASFAAQDLSGDPEYKSRQASTKLLRGAVNLVTGTGEMIRQPILCTMEDGWQGVPVGLINGVFMSILRTGGGAIEVLTFPWALDDSRNYYSLLDPAYVWQRHE